MKVIKTISITTPLKKGTSYVRQNSHLTMWGECGIVPRDKLSRLVRPQYAKIPAYDAKAEPSQKYQSDYAQLC